MQLGASIPADRRADPAGDAPRGRARPSLLLAAYAISALTFILSFFIIELVFFRLIFPTANPGVRPRLHETPGVLAQSTKSGFAPRDYIAILGDSIAEGLGDALLAAGHNDARAFHAAHVIRDLTGRDVVSFGRGGSGSAEGLVRQPARILHGSRCLAFPTIEEPREIFAYFYEGNDIQDNLAFAKKVIAKYGRADEQTIDGYLSENYASFGMWRCHLYLFDAASRMWRFFYQYHYAGRDPFEFRSTIGGSELRVGQDVFNAPAPLDGPAIEIGDEDMRAGLRVFERSLIWLKARFPRVPITVVYVPTALSTYRLAGSSYRYSIEPRDDGRSDWASVAQIAGNSDRICSAVQAASARHGLSFFDSRPVLREAAVTRFLHGPVDWVHFNADGYRVLGKALAERVERPQVDRCVSLSPAIAAQM